MLVGLLEEHLGGRMYLNGVNMFKQNMHNMVILEANYQEWNLDLYGK